MSILADLIGAGVAPELIERVALAVAEARAEGAREALETRRAADRLRQERFRQSRYVTLDNVTNVSHVTPPPRVRAFSVVDSSSITPSEATPPLPPSPKTARGSRMTPDWQPSISTFDFAAELGFQRGHADAVLAEFRDYWIAVPGAKAKKLDWDATFRNRLRDKAPRRAGGTGPPSSGKVSSGMAMVRELLTGYDDAGPDQNRRDGAQSEFSRASPARLF